MKNKMNDNKNDNKLIVRLWIEDESAWIEINDEVKLYGSGEEEIMIIFESEPYRTYTGTVTWTYIGLSSICYIKVEEIVEDHAY